MIIILTYFFRHVAQPIGLYFGIKKDESNNKNVKSSGDYQLKISEKTRVALEEYFKSCNNPSESILNVSDLLKVEKI